MKKIFIFACILIQSITAVGFAANDSLLFGKESTQILVNNRILATANGKPISVFDIMKKMDVLFYKQYPQYSSNTIARFQFYKINWKNVLRDLVDKELIIADAKESKLPITHGEIRKEMELTFGPNIILNLDKAGITFDEAWQMMEDDLIIRRMVGFRAQLKGYKRITPQVVREAYEEFAQKNIRPEEWEYAVVSIRDTDATVGAETANLAYQYLSETPIAVEEMGAKLETLPSNASSKVTVSELFRHNEASLSPSYKEALLALTPGSISLPVAQKSRKDNSTIFRIFYLKEHTHAGAPLFNDVENQLRQKLLEDAIEEETTAYFDKLHKHYHVSEDSLEELITNGFEPFVIK